MTQAQDITSYNYGDSRVFVQESISPAVAPEYNGCASVTPSEVSVGDITPVYCPSPDQLSRWDIVGEIRGTPDLPTATVTARAMIQGGDVWYELSKRGCKFDLFLPIGKCAEPGALMNQWTSLQVLRDSAVTTYTPPMVNPLSGGDNEVANIEVATSYRTFEALRRLVWSEYADSTVLAEVLDGFYRDYINCGDCGTASDGCRKWYWLTAANSGSPGLSSQIVVSVDNKSTHFVLNLPLGGLSANRMTAMGVYLVVVSQANAAHYYATFEDVDAQTASFTAVTGYVAGKAPRAIYAKNPSAAFVAGAGGYVYLLTSAQAAPLVITDGSLTVQDFNDIRGAGETIVAVGNSNAIVYSTNGGASFASVTAPTAQAGKNITTVEAVSESLWFIGYNDGKVYYTANAGTSWTQATLPGGETVINSIRFASRGIGYMAVQVSSGARIYSTVDTGATWYKDKPRLTGLITAERYNMIAACGENQVGAGGRVSAGGDGVLIAAL